jgi:dimethylsulfone monooxygenase
MTVLDGTVPTRNNRLLSSPSQLKLAVFGANCSGGCSMTSAEGTIEVSWDESRRIAQAADRAGIEAMIPIARWRGFGGDTDFQSRSFETITWAAGLAAATERIQVFATFHVPTVHPLRLAKEVATIDHIAGGRFGLNIVAGWNAEELAMFGLDQREHDQRYAVADEFMAIVRRLYAETEPFDYLGEFFTVVGGFTSPRPVQTPFPLTMCAGVSKAGRAFAAANADIMFIAIDSFETGRKAVAEIKEQARASSGRDIRVFAQTHIVCAPTEVQARREYDYFVKEKGDFAGAENLLAQLMPNSAMGDFERTALKERIIAGWAATSLVGTPEQVVEGFAKLADTGLDGVTMSWVNYDEGLDQFRDELLPLLIETGVRADEQVTSPSPV